MKRYRTSIALLTAALLAAPALVSAQAPGAAKSTSEQALSESERNFMIEAAKGGMAEVELGKLAGERAPSDGVKQFGRRMVTDHSKANDELTALAQDKGVSLPRELNAKHRALRDRLAKLSGAQFDRAYVEEMVKDHRKDVAEFRREADRARDPDLKSWAGKTLPILEDHLKQVEGLQNQVKTSRAPAR